MRKYYFYATTNAPNWYTLTTDVLRETRNRNEDGSWRGAFPVLFVFTGKYTEAEDKDEAESNFRNKVNLSDCKEPACMTMARRDFFEKQFMVV